MVLPEENKNLEELLKEPQKDLKGKVKYTGFCTIFLKRKNKPLLSFETMEGFTEDHGKAIALMKGAMGDLDSKLFDVLKEFVNQTGELDKDTKVLIAEFDKRFRVLIG